MDIVAEFQSIQTLFEAWYLIIMLTILGFVLGMFFIIILNKDKGYEQGQIDAINGKIKYKLTKNKNGETVWKEIKEN